MADNNRIPRINPDYLKEWFDKQSITPLETKYMNWPKRIDVDNIVTGFPPEFSKDKCIVCSKQLSTKKEIDDYMCCKCEETTSKIAHQFNVEDRFDILENTDLKRWEFNPKGDWIGYLVSFNECDNREDAIIAVWKSFKSTTQ